ncbi:hypothetical protein Tsubulata_011595, partial [Turnera subulata]
LKKMAEIVLTFVVEEMLKKLASLALEGIDLAWGLKGKLQKLNSTLIFIRSVLHDAEEKQGRQDSVKSWLQRLRDVAYEAEDVVDRFGYEVLRQKVEGSSPSKKVSNFFSASYNPIAFQLHMGKKIKKINDELTQIKDDAELLKKLALLALERIGLARGLKGKLQKLNDSLTFIRAVLYDAVERQAREESLKIWLRKLREVAHEAEDVLDEFGYEVLRQKVEDSTPNKKFVETLGMPSSLRHGNSKLHQ